MIDLAPGPAPLARFAVDLRGPRWPQPDLSAYAEADRAAARVAWAARIVDEYRSVAVFAELAHLLADLEAPFAALCAVQRLIGDELRHAAWCAEVAGWLGGHADCAIDLADVGLPDRGATTKAQRAAAIVGRELVVAEEESVTALAAYRAATSAPGPRAVLAALVRDEARHAAAGRALLALFTDGALARTISDDDRAELAATMAADRAELRAHYRAAARGGPGRALGAALAPGDLRLPYHRAR
ncbi:MAG: hypothetical protein IPL61_12465 [Myxococcales bacterium]|nr:hypothetical protein [Myxococcales bacterium]